MSPRFIHPPCSLNAAIDTIRSSGDGDSLIERDDMQLHSQLGRFPFVLHARAEFDHCCRKPLFTAPLWINISVIHLYRDLSSIRLSRYILYRRRVSSCPSTIQRPRVRRLMGHSSRFHGSETVYAITRDRDTSAPSLQAFRIQSSPQSPLQNIPRQMASPFSVCKLAGDTTAK